MQNNNAIAEVSIKISIHYLQNIHPFPEEIQDWKQELSEGNKESWIRPGITDNLSAETENKG